MEAATARTLGSRAGVSLADPAAPGFLSLCSVPVCSRRQLLCFSFLLEQLCVVLETPYSLSTFRLFGIVFVLIMDICSLLCH